MAKFRSRSCPKCGFYLAFSIAKRAPKAIQTAVTNFCLNCNYKLPVFNIWRGARRATRAPKRRALKLISHGGNDPIMEPNATSTSKSASRDFSRHLRIIGQDLENLQLETFNLEFTGDAYLLWVRPESATASSNPLLRVSRSRLQKLWKNRVQHRSIGQEESYTRSDAQPARRLRYTIQELERIERERRLQRRRASGSTDGHGLSQLLRTVGALIEQRNERLLGVSWQELSVSLVVETVQGRKEIDVYRPDNLYDLWVKMYLKRDTRAISDVPR